MNLPSQIHLVCALTMLCSSHCPKHYRNFPFPLSFGSGGFWQRWHCSAPMSPTFCRVLPAAQWSILPNLWVFAQPLGFHPTYGFSSSLWIFTQPLDFHPAFGSSLNLFVFAQPLCLHPTFVSSPNLWVFTQPLVFTQLFKAEACCSCNRMNPVYLFVFIVLN